MWIPGGNLYVQNKFNNDSLKHLVSFNSQNGYAESGQWVLTQNGKVLIDEMGESEYTGQDEDGNIVTGKLSDIIRTLSKEEILKESSDIVYDGEYVSNYVTSITDQNDLPEFFIETYIKLNNFILKEFKISDLIEMDQDLKEYIDYNQDRYEGWEDYPNHENLENPIIIYDDIVLDGYNRILMLKREGINKVKAFKNV